MIPSIASSQQVPVLEPMRLVLVPLECFYCGNSTDGKVMEWRIHHLFGLFHCETHTWCAERDCKTFMRRHEIMRRQDALKHPILGPFLSALGTHIPVLRTSGEVQQDWRFPVLDEIPLIRRSKTTQEWGFNLTNGILDKFVSLHQFQDARVSSFLSMEVQQQIEGVISCMETGVYVE